jgi:hypothetical protein
MEDNPKQLMIILLLLEELNLKKLILTKVVVLIGTNVESIVNLLKIVNLIKAKLQQPLEDIKIFQEKVMKMNFCKDLWILDLFLFV